MKWKKLWEMETAFVIEVTSAFIIIKKCVFIFMYQHWSDTVIYLFWVYTVSVKISKISISYLFLWTESAMKIMQYASLRKLDLVTALSILSQMWQACFITTTYNHLLTANVYLVVLSLSQISKAAFNSSPASIVLKQYAVWLWVYYLSGEL